MNQDAIWDHFQNEGVAVFGGSAGRLEYLVRHLVPGERVLNIGVGAGILETLAKRAGVEIWSLDPSERAIERLRDVLGMGQRAIQGYSQSIPLPDRSFDVVIMSEVLEHLDPDVFHNTLIEVRRILVDGGKFMGTVPAQEALSESLVVCPDCGNHFHRWGHQQSFTHESMTSLLCGQFNSVQVKELFFIEWYSANWPKRLKGLLKRFLSDCRLGTYGANRNLFFLARN